MSPGQAIGPYQLLEKLGAGGMGEVYKAQDTRVGRNVALKILPDSLAADGDRRRRFEQEARLAASLNHPNVMAIYDVGLDAHPPYIVAELVPGESLRAIIGRGPLPARKAVDIAAQIAAGLAAAHAAGIVHRDLKPENLMVTPDGTVKILDFGVARAQAKPVSAGETATIGQTAAGAVLGTAAYMSPEQARAEEVDYRSDQFSLGLVLYEMLSGKQAFSKPSAVQTMSAIVEDDPPPLDRGIPTPLRWILERCLAKERQARYESTRDLARELAQLRDHYGELTSATGNASAAVGRPSRRVPAWTLAAVAVASALAAWLVSSLLLRDPRAVDISRYHLTPFATAMEEQGTPAWSPDGKSIAFLGHPAGAASALYVQGVDSPTAQAVSGNDVSMNGTTTPPFWSPDSRSIYFRCTLKSGGWGLCRVPASGGSSVLIQPNEVAGAVSPDGSVLAAFTFPDAKLLIQHPVGNAPREYQPSPVKIESYYNNPGLAFAPDGKSLLFSIGLSGRGETTWKLPWPAGPARQVFPQTSEFAYTPIWSWLPDSRHLVFADSTATSYTRLYIADVSKETYWPALVQDRPATAPTVSPDGKRVAYSSILSHTDIVSVPLQDGPVKIVLSTARTQQMVDFSPGGQMVYASNRSGVNNLWMTSLAEGWDRQLVSISDIRVGSETAQFLMTPEFSRDGKRVAFAAKLPSSDRIFTVFASGGTPVEATNRKGDFEMTPAWSPDGNWLAYMTLSGLKPELMKVRPGSGEPPVALGEYYGWAVPEWSPTGEWIACHRRPDDRLLLLSPDGKPVRELTSDEGPVAWSADGKKLYQVQMKPPALVEIDVATGAVKKLRDLGDLRPYSSMNPGLKATLTPDAKNIVYTVNRPRQEIWILSGL